LASWRRHSRLVPAPISAQGQGRNEGLVPFQRDLTKELANKMKGTYVVAAVGDVLMQEPMGKMIDPAIQKILREADTTIGNKEGYVLDSRNWPYGHGGNWAPKELAQDLADLGFDILAPGEGNGGEEGMKSAAKWYGEVGIQIAGQGPNLSTCAHAGVPASCQRASRDGRCLPGSRSWSRLQRTKRGKPQRQ
jgi:hypothetical protein